MTSFKNSISPLLLRWNQKQTLKLGGGAHVIARSKFVGFDIENFAPFSFSFCCFLVLRRLNFTRTSIADANVVESPFVTGRMISDDGVGERKLLDAA